MPVSKRIFCVIYLNDFGHNLLYVCIVYECGFKVCKYTPDLLNKSHLMHQCTFCFRPNIRAGWLLHPVLVSPVSASFRLSSTFTLKLATGNTEHALRTSNQTPELFDADPSSAAGSAMTLDNLWGRQGPRVCSGCQLTFCQPWHRHRHRQCQQLLSVKFLSLCQASCLAGQFDLCDFCFAYAIPNWNR